MFHCPFKDLIFSLLMFAAYVALTSVYCALRLSLSSSLFLVLWYSLRGAFVLFLSTVNSWVHQGTVLWAVTFFVAPTLGMIYCTSVSGPHWTRLFFFRCLVLRLLVSLVSRPCLMPLCRGFCRVVTSLSVRRFLEIWLSSPSICRACSVCCVFHWPMPGLMPYLMVLWSERLSWSLIAHPETLLISWGWLFLSQCCWFPCGFWMWC